MQAQPKLQQWRIKLICAALTVVDIQAQANVIGKLKKTNIYGGGGGRSAGLSKSYRIGEKKLIYDALAVVQVQALAKVIGSENESNMSGDVGGGFSGVGKGIGLSLIHIQMCIRDSAW